MAGMGDISEILGADGMGQADEGQGQETDQGLGQDQELDATGADTGTGGDQPGGEQQVDDDLQQFGGRKTVPLGALQEERTRRQELQEQLRAREQQTQLMEQRFQQMMQLFQQQQSVQLQQQQPQAQQQEIPAFVDDPEGHINALREKVERELAQVREFQQQLTQQQLGAQQGQQLAQKVASQEQEFMAKTPDYPAAAEFFMQRKAMEYAALGLDPVSVQAQVQRDYHNIAIHATQTGKNPAELLYNLSKTLGFSGQQQGQQQGAQKPKAPTSLSNANGVSRSPEEQMGMSLEALSSMSDAEFEKFWKQMERQGRQAPRV